MKAKKTMTIAAIIELLRCPIDGQPLHACDGWLITADGLRRYPQEDGIAALLPEKAQYKTPDGQWQNQA